MQHKLLMAEIAPTIPSLTLLNINYIFISSLTQPRIKCYQNYVFLKVVSIQKTKLATFLELVHWQMCKINETPNLTKNADY